MKVAGTDDTGYMMDKWQVLDQAQHQEA